jgi:tetratricopeptide (TPR) repeat protein
MPPYLELATIETQRGRKDGALLAITEALKIWPDNDDLLKVLASISPMNGRTATAAPKADGKKLVVSPLAKSAMLYSRKDVIGLMSESETALYQGDLARAKNALQLAMKLSPEDPEPHWRLCQLLEAEGDTSNAIAEALNAVGLDKENPQWYLVLGWAYSRAGKWQPSFEAFKEAFRRDNSLHDAVVGECYALAKQKQNMLARITLHISDPDAHDTSWYHAANGLILEEKGDLPAACKELVRASEIAPNDYQIKYTMARVAYQLACKDNKKQSWRDATEHAKALLAIMPCDVEVLTNLGVCLSSTGENDNAIKTMERAVRIAPSNAAAHAAFASVLAAAGRTEEARNQAKMAKKLDPSQKLADSILQRLK